MKIDEYYARKVLKHTTPSLIEAQKQIFKTLNPYLKELIKKDYDATIRNNKRPA